MLRLFDTPHHELDGVRLEIAPTKPAALALFLAVQGDWVARERLMLMFAPDLNESAARHHLRVLLNRTKQLNWVTNLEAQATRLRFVIPSDVKAFREAIGRGDHHEALAWHQKPMLKGFRVGAPEFEAWCGIEREAFVRAWTDAAQKLARQLLETDPNAAARVLKTVLEQDDLAEDVLHAYLEAAYLAGNREEAMRTFERFKEKLKIELQLEPLDATMRLAQTIRDAKPLTSSSSERTFISGTPIKVLRPSRLAGRAHELEQLQSLNARLVLIAAEPGSGKTRLLEEAVTNAIWLRCTEGLESVPYQPVIEFVRTQMPYVSLGAYIEDLARLIPEIMPGATPSPADPSSAKSRLLEALARLLEGSAKALVFDDLQWADSSSLELLAFLVHRGKSQIYGAYRIHEKSAMLERTLSGLGSTGKLETITLNALDVNAMRDLLADLIGIPEGPERFSRWLATRSNGNVFFALEMLKSLFENGVLEARDGDWHTALDEITNDYSELEVPPRVTQLIARRFARLSENTQRLLSVASVIGASFETKLLSSLTELSTMAAIEALEEAEQHGFVVANRFCHDLFRQILYQQIPSAKRQYFHASLAQAISGGQTDALIVAEHWRKAGQLREAWKLELDAAKDQFERGLLTAGFETLDSVLNAPNSEPFRLEALILAGTYQIFVDLNRSDAMLLEALNTVGINAEQRLKVFLSLADNAVYHGDMTAASDHIQSASAYVHENLNLELKLVYGFARLEVMLRSGQFDAADALLPEIDALEPKNLKTASYEAQLRFYQGQYKPAANLFEQMRIQDPNCVYTITLENDLAVAYWWVGQLKQAESEIMQSLEHWTGSSHVEALSFMNLGFIRLSQGRFSDALDALRKAKELGKAFGSLTFEGDIENRLGTIYFHAGRLSQALPHLQKSVELMRKVGDPYRLLTALSILVSVNALMGDLENANQNLLEAEKLLEHTKNQAASGFLTQGKALIELARGNTKKASGYALEVETFAREFELQEFLCMALFFRAKLEPDPKIYLTEMLEIAIGHGFVFQEFLAANALKDTARADKNLRFLRQHAPNGWF